MTGGQGMGDDGAKEGLDESGLVEAPESVLATGEVLSSPIGAVGALLAQPGIANGLPEAIHAALRSAQDAWRVTEEGGPGEAESPYVYENPANSRVAAQVAATAALEYLAGGRVFTRYEEVAPDEVTALLDGVRYKDWSFGTVRLPDGTVGVKVVAPLEDHNHPGRLFRTSRIAPIGALGALRQRVLAAALQAVMAIEEHEAREGLQIGGERPLDPHLLPSPTNRVRRSEPADSAD